MAINFQDSYPIITWDLNRWILSKYYIGSVDDSANGYKLMIVQNGDVLVPSTEEVYFYFKKSDNTNGYIKATIDNNYFLIELTNQVYSTSGNVSCNFQITDGSKWKTSPEFIIKVDANNIADSIESSNDFIAFQNALNSLVDITETANATIDTANQAITNINNTNTTVQNAEDIRIETENERIIKDATRLYILEKTQAQYDALTEEEKDDPLIMYQIIDNQDVDLGNELQTLIDNTNLAKSNAEAVAVSKTGVNDNSVSTTESWSSQKINNYTTDIYGKISNHDSLLAQNASHIDTTVKGSALDKAHKLISDSNKKLYSATYIMVGDSTRASNGAYVYDIISKVLNQFNVKTYLSAQSGLKAENWSKTTIDTNYIDIDDVIALIPDDDSKCIIDICLGINDTGGHTFEQVVGWIQAGIAAIKAVKPNVIIILTSPNRHQYSPSVEKLISAYDYLCNTYGYGYIDVMRNVFRVWSDSMIGTNFVDNTHPNEYGQRDIAEYIIRHLIPNYIIQPSKFYTVTVPNNYYVKLGTFTIKAQWVGFSAKFIIQSILGKSYEPNSVMLSVSGAQTAALGSDALKIARLKILNLSSSTLEFKNTSFVLRTVSVTSTQTVIEIYLKNETGGDRRYVFSALEGVASIKYYDCLQEIGSSLTPTASMTAAQAGTTDVNSTYETGVYLARTDGTPVKLVVDNSNVVSATTIS